MKTIKILIIAFFLVSFYSCSLVVDVDDEDERGKISASVSGSNSDGSVSVGGYLDIVVNVFDRDGIGSVRIEIPALDVDFITNIDSHDSTESINQTFNVDEIDSNESKTILVTLIDKDGNNYTRIIAFVAE